jgi:membrane protein DedA with SNARE-associated domain
MFLPEGEIHHLLAMYGPWAVAAIVGLESMGLPLPGETALIFASIYAGSHGNSIIPVIAAAAVGAIIGDNLGYLIGREFGFKILQRFGPRLGLTEGRIKLGQYLFMLHGAKVVFFGRFVAVLRVLAAFLAGVNQMPWKIFFAANAAGAVLWATIFGLAASTFGRSIRSVEGPLGIIGLILAVVAFIAAAMFLKRHESELQAKAERALPGPIRKGGRHRPSTAT